MRIKGKKGNDEMLVWVALAVLGLVILYAFYHLTQDFWSGIFSLYDRLTR